MILIGVDPGTIVCGYGVILVEGSSYRAIDYGCIKPPPSYEISDRYLIISNCIEELLDKHKPKTVIVETQFVHKNVQSAIKLGMAKGVVIVASARRGIPVVDTHPPRQN